MGQYNEPKTGRFMGMSTILHAAAITGVMVMSITADLQTSKGDPTVVEFTVSNSTELAAAAPVVVETPKTKMIESRDKEDVIVKAKTAPKVVAKKSSPVKPKIAKIQPAQKETSNPSKIIETQTPVAPVVSEMSEEDFNLPMKNAKEVLAESQTQLNEADVDDSIAQVNSENEQMDNEKNHELVGTANALVADLESEGKENAKILAQANNEDAERMHALSQERIRGELAAIQKAEQEARQKAAAIGNGSGAGTAKQASSGSPDGVRSLDQLRQMPGNKKPQYDQDDRFAGKQGEISLLAYISKAGVPTEFKLLQSTGHRTLDSKTLAAIKPWRFYPGQEGWVEIPFRWDLKGEAQPISGGLRTSNSKY